MSEIERNAKGQFVKGGNNPHAITTENHPKTVEAKTKKTTEQARQAILHEIASVLPDIETFEEGWGGIIGYLGSQSVNPDQKLRDQVQAAKLVGAATDAMPDRQTQTGHTTINLLPDSVKIEVARLMNLAPVHEPTSEGVIVDVEARQVGEVDEDGSSGEEQGKRGV